MRVLIAAGGTAGHINPALAIAGALRAADSAAEIHFAGRQEGMEYRLVTQAGYPFHHIEVTGFQRKPSLKNLERNLVTVYNLARSGPRCRAILNECPEVLHYSGIWTDTLRGGETMLVNTNKLLRRYEGITGLKTGTTGGAGVCISASASRNGLDLIAVVLGSDSSAERFEVATRLLDYGFANYEAAPLPDLSGRPLYLAVTGGDETDVPLDYSALPDSLLVPRGGGAALMASVELPETLPAPLTLGSEVGRVTVCANGAEVGAWPVYAAAGAGGMDFAAAVRLMAESFL